MFGVLVLLSLLIPAVWYGHRVLRLAVAYKAKILCSGIFVSGRSAQEVLASDLSWGNHAPFRWIPAVVDPGRNIVVAGWPWCVSGRAVWRPGIGSTLIHPPHVEVSALAYPLGIPIRSEQHRQPSDATDWRESYATPLRPVLDRAFVEQSEGPSQRTRAIVVIHHGTLVGEAYAPGFGPEVPLAGWSLAKMVINTLTGLLVGEGKLGLGEPAPVAAWSRAGDPRGAITIEHLLRMTSGLRFSETYTNLTEDLFQMLLAESNSALFAARKPLDHPPGTHWQYSGGTTNILSGVIRTVLGDQNYATFPQNALFGPLGLRTATMEMDAAGNFVGSSFMYASARDWARLGQLYLQDGCWQGKQLLPAGWVDFSRNPTPQAGDEVFGAHMWLRCSNYYKRQQGGVRLPSDAYHAIGYEGQFISIIPSEDLVVVRLGVTRRPRTWLHEEFVSAVIAALQGVRHP